MRECALCHKGSIMVGHRKKLRGKYNPTNRSRKYPNFQWARLSNGQRVKICTQCLRTLAKNAK